MQGADLRVAVVTTESRAVSNHLWYAVHDRVADLVIVGGPNTEKTPLAPYQRELSQVDLGRGLIYRHLRGIHQILDKFRPDVIHVNGELWGLTCQELLCRREKLVVHGAENIWAHGNPLERRVRDLLVGRALRRIDGYASWNLSGSRHVEAANPETPTMTYPAIIPPPEFRSIPWTGPSSDDFVVALIGSLIPRKGFAGVIEAVGGLASRRLFRVLVCGEGPLDAALRSRAEELEVQVEILGHLSPQRLAAVLGSSSAVVQPSLTTADWSEQFGRSVAEAMTVGVPCFVSSSGALPEVVGFSEAVFPEGDASAIGALLERARLDPRFTEKIRTHQAGIASRWTPAVAAQTLINYWSEL